MFCMHCGAQVGETDRVCSQCGALTDYGEKLARHEAVPPRESTPAINPDGSLNPDAAKKSDGFFDGPQGAQANANGDGASARGGYYYAPQNAVPPQQQAAASSESNSMAIAGFVLSFIIPLVGLILSIIGLKRSKEMGDSGKGLAIAGIVVSACSMFFSFFLMSTVIEALMDQLSAAYVFLTLF